MINDDSMAYRRILSLKSRCKEHPIVLTMVDGLDYLTARNELLPALIEKGLYPESGVAPYFSFLPTETPIAKPALVCGKTPSQVPDETPDAAYYKNVAQGLFKIPDADIKAATDKEKTIMELVNEPARLYLYLDNHLDREYLHAQYNSYIRKRKYAEHAAKLADSLLFRGVRRDSGIIR